MMIIIIIISQEIEPVKYPTICFFLIFRQINSI